MRVYAMSYREVMGLPMRMFWHLQGSAGRVIAEEHRDLLNLLSASQSSEAATQMREALTESTPEAITFTREALIKQTSARDSDATDRLRSLGG